MSDGARGVMTVILVALLIALALGEGCEGSSGGVDMWDNPGWRYDR